MENVNNACIEELVKLIKGIKKISSWFTHEKRLIIVFENGVNSDDVKKINDVIEKFTECHYLVGDYNEALFNHKNNKDYKTIYIELKENVTINKFAKGGNLKKNTKTNSNFERWFKGSKVVDENGKPLVVYHATTHEFFEFTKERGNVQNHFGIGYYFTSSEIDAKTNYLSDGADLTQRIEIDTDNIESELQNEFSDIFKDKKAIAKKYGVTLNQITIADDFRGLAKIIAQKKLKGKHEKVLSCYLKFLNPINISRDKNETYYDSIYTFSEDGEDNIENEDSLPMKLYEAIRSVSYEFNGVDFQAIWSDISEQVDGFIEEVSAYDVDKAFRKSGSLIEVVDNEGNLAGNEFIRMVYEEMGFDGIIMNANIEFGNKREFGQPMIMDENTKHFIAFNSNQIKLADGSNTTFDENNADIRFSGGGNLTKKWNEVRKMKKSEAKKFYNSEEGNALDKETYKKWKSLVNMSKSELEKFYNSQEGKDAGLSSSEAKKEGIDSGRESARWIMKMKNIPYSKWTSAMWKWAKKQISFISRMRGNKGELYDEKGNKTRKHTSLLIWGHNPKKFNNGSNLTVEKTVEKKKFGGNLDSQMDDFFNDDENKIDETPEIVVESLQIGSDLVNKDYYDKIKKIPLIKKFITKIKAMNLYDLGWRFQFGTSKQWAGLCDAGMSEIAKSKTKNIYISIDFVKHDNNWKANSKSVILHEIAHAIVFEIFHFDSENKGKLHDIDDLHRISKGHGMVWKAVCKAISGNDCRVHYENASFKETFKRFRAECSSCENMDYGDSPNFTDECSKCGKFVTVEPNNG